MARKAVRWMDGRRCLQAQPGTDANLPHVNRRREEPAVRKILRPHVATARIQQAGSSNLIHLQRAGADADVEAARDVQHVRRIVQAARPRIGQQRARQAGAQAAGVAPLQVCHVAAQLPHQPASYAEKCRHMRPKPSSREAELHSKLDYCARVAPLQVCHVAAQLPHQPASHEKHFGAC